jgi:hypothetical protein
VRRIFKVTREIKKEEKEMKRKITLSIALALSVVLLSLMSSDSTAKAQNQIRIGADTGVVTLGPNQVLRITAVNRSRKDSTIRFRSAEYSQDGCAGGICRLAVGSANTSVRLTLAPGEAVSADFTSALSGGVRAVASPDGVDYDNWTYFTAIVNSSTGEVTAVQMSIQRENQ